MKITAPLGNGDDDGETIVRKGDVGTAVGMNCEYKSKLSGEDVVALRMDDGQIAVVPRRAVKSDRARKFFLFR